MRLKTAKDIIRNINSPKISDEDKEEAIDVIVDTNYENLPNKYDLWQALKWAWSE